MADRRLKVIAQALDGESTYELHVEPWGAIFDIAPGRPASVIFTCDSESPSISTCRGSDYLIVCAEGGIRDYRVEDKTGAELSGR